ncbi:MAG: DEAD/DEAH box helicase, partial [Bacteroidaceae bacterium]|nr:DEAD/DEAH box helicase [Bacteroidaceae bacterium]
MFAECLLPLPLQGTFTYHIPAHLEDSVQVGCRVNVPFGKGKQYAALVVGVSQQLANHTVADAGGRRVEVKDVLSVPDDRPMLLPQQLKLWKWVADYYMCTLGEVYKAAIPSGLKEKDGVVRYHPKTVTCIRLANAYFDATRLNVAMGVLRVAPKQQQLMICYVELAGVNAALVVNNPGVLKEITREELMRAAGCSPAILKAVVDRGLLEQYTVQVSRIASAVECAEDEVAQPVLPALSDAQDEAYSSIVRNWQDRDVCLLHGVTSSGKTEIYIHLIQKALDEGRQVLYLLPEIVLTSQLTQRLRRVFGNRLGVYHSKYTDAERVEVYQKQVSSNPYDIIVGVRSSVLLPFQRLGLVIVDEEHENSFKQTEPAPRYHARNVALVLARMAGAKTLLGTATPSLESYYNAQSGKYGL